MIHNATDEKFTGESRLAEQIEQALEILRRIRTAQEARPRQPNREDCGNTYVVPEPVVYPAQNADGIYPRPEDCGNTYVLPEPVVYPASSPQSINSARKSFLCVHGMAPIS